MRTYIKLIAVLLACVTVLLFGSSFAGMAATSLTATVAGDINADGSVTVKDLTRLKKYLSAGDGSVEVAANAVDVNGDGAENVKDLTRLKRYLAGSAVDIFLSTSAGVTCTSFVYGTSERGRDLICYSISGATYDRTILVNFAIHGFEDNYAHDGQVLADAAHALIETYKASELVAENNCRLLIIPCANPDGLLDGTTNNGFGRCNANGVDLNRDFDANYVPNTTNARNYTPYAFSAAESRALRDLCLEYEPDVVLDMHGWLNTTIGDAELAEVFFREMGLPHQVGFTSTNCQGYFANWAHQQGALALLVEFTNPNINQTNLTNAIDALVKGEYGNDSVGEDDYTVDERYSQFIDAQGYPLSTGRVTTYQGFGIPFPTTSYIDGTTDLCTVHTVYANGWVEVTYPVTGGTKTAYCKLTDFIADSQAVAVPYQVTVNKTTTVYRRSDLSASLGSATTASEIWVVAESDTAVQIMCRTTTGNLLLGWVASDSVIAIS